MVFTLCLGERTGQGCDERRLRVLLPTSSRWSPATAPAREMMLFPLHPLMAGTADFHKLKWRTDTVKLYLLVLEMCNNEIEKSCSQPQTHQKSHSHPQQFQGLQPNNSDVRGSGYLDKIFPAAYTFEIYQSRTSGERFRPNHAHCTSLLKDFLSPT